MKDKKSSPASTFQQWDVVKVRVYESDRDEHYVVVISPDEICEKGTRINVLYGSTRRPAEPLQPCHVLLNGADGFERQTAIDCTFLHVIPKVKITSVAGRVAHVRRREIQRQINAALRFFQ
ncbi:MAG: type II toxin-antitoxin system PemK/MazF family toxin [Opitutaceae bacterium]|jgi:mRNA-degrading endonuclease toxin of MazEF toxin-antitoxin module|nr:type II toxin-antitoxin system PemK/MazF family toxin [Opitutaceae bacterium]